jgi:hypothetical protein
MDDVSNFVCFSTEKILSASPTQHAAMHRCGKKSYHVGPHRERKRKINRQAWARVGKRKILQWLGHMPVACMHNMMK